MPEDDKKSDTENSVCHAPFSQEEIVRIIRDVFDHNIGFSPYSFQQSNEWNTKCVEGITAELVKLDRPYKYIVTSSLLQTGNGSGLNVSTVSFWNKGTDISFSHRWEGKHMLAIVNVFAVAY